MQPKGRLMRSSQDRQADPLEGTTHAPTRRRAGTLTWLIRAIEFGGALLLPVILLYVFGLSARTTEEYACTMRLLEENFIVLREVGRPIRPGLFAWTSYFESAGGMRQGAFSTTISGPNGRAKVRVRFYRTPIGARLYVGLKTSVDEIVLYDGAYPCNP